MINQKLLVTLQSDAQAFHKTTLQCRILLQKLIVHQLVKKFPAFYWTKCLLLCSKQSTIDPILRQINPVLDFCKQSVQNNSRVVMVVNQVATEYVLRDEILPYYSICLSLFDRTNPSVQTAHSHCTGGYYPKHLFPDLFFF